MSGVCPLMSGQCLVLSGFVRPGTPGNRPGGLGCGSFFCTISYRFVPFARGVRLPRARLPDGPLSNDINDRYKYDRDYGSGEMPELERGKCQSMPYAKTIVTRLPWNTDGCLYRLPGRYTTNRVSVINRGRQQPSFPEGCRRPGSYTSRTGAGRIIARTRRKLSGLHAEGSVRFRPTR